MTEEKKGAGQNILSFTLKSWFQQLFVWDTCHIASAVCQVRHTPVPLTQWRVTYNCLSSFSRSNRTSEMLCHGNIYSWYVFQDRVAIGYHEDTNYSETKKENTVDFYKHKRNKTSFLLYQELLVHGTQGLACCSISVVFIRPFGQWVYTGMCYNCKIKIKNKKDEEKESHFSEKPHVYTVSMYISYI